METLQRLKLSVAQSFEDSFDTAYSDLHAGLAARDARVKDAEERANRAEEARQRAVSETDVLKQEILLLRQELWQDEIDDTSTKRELELSDIYEPNRVFRKDFSKVNAADFQKVHDRYFQLYQQSQTLIEASGDLKNLVKRYKKRVAILQAEPRRQPSAPLPDACTVSPRHLEDTRPVGLSASHSHPTPEARSSIATSRSLEPTVSARELATPVSDIPLGQNGDSNGDEERSGNGNRLLEVHPELYSTPSDSSTENPELPHIAAEAPGAHSDTLKRKRAVSAWPLPARSLPSGVSGMVYSSQPAMVKSETLSSSPLHSHSVHRGPPGTQDLDDVGDTVVTPTKRVRYKEQEYHRAPSGLPSFQRLVRANSTDREHQIHCGGSRILQPINSNLRIPSTTAQTQNRGSSKKIGSVNRISSLTEDGDENEPPVFVRRRGVETPQRLQHAPDPSTTHRLSNLLEGTSPASRNLHVRAIDDAHTPTLARISKSPAQNTMSTTDASAIVPQVIPRLDAQGDSGDSSTNQLERPGQLVALPDDESYRARPLQRLGLGHFKINPDYNHGLDYAYSEVVRKRDERKCANGCTRPGCCGGKFIAMARFGIPVDSAGKTMSDREVLEEYLGEDQNLIDTLSSADRENLLIEAKARVFADRFGKHRHQHHRPGTPPGFWRTEMPGTQELEDDHHEAQRQEREKIKERYRETMRPDGQWIFADE
ncbi:SAE2 C-terminal domain-containing protein [Aspergillus stella-maris]|uniref:SAE2 C-terminal domain-containing protein n=1 Tax=Aspergillus stella-maris TaxID=1810926 RepID=UPI003CCD0AAE